MAAPGFELRQKLLFFHGADYTQGHLNGAWKLMELYIYETPEGNVADFRPYLDGFDHSFADHRELASSDLRLEKVSNLKHPTYQYDLEGKLRYIGRAAVRWKELMIFPISWDGEYAPVEWGDSSVDAES